MVKIVKHLGRQVIVEQDNKFYLVSESRMGATETMIFECNGAGVVESWNEVGGAQMSLETFLPIVMEHGVHYKEWDDFPW